MNTTPHDERPSSVFPTALAVALLAAACGGVEDGEMVEELGIEHEAFSDSGCRAATPDATFSISTANFNVTGDTPVTYSNPAAPKSYVWTFKKSHLSPSAAFPEHNLITTLPGFPPSAYNTKAECNGLSIHRRIYFNNTLRYTSVDSGHWDSEFGCALPRLFGDMINPVGELFGPSSTIRVCAMAVDRNANTVPMRVTLRSADLVGQLFTNPKVEQRPIRGDDASGREYCKKRGFAGMTGGTTGACTKAYIYWHQLGFWHVPALPSGASCSDVWTQLTCKG